MSPFPTSFVILSQGRTGSSYLVSCLNSSPSVLCYPEILADRSVAQQQNLLNGFFDGRRLEAKHPEFAKRHYHPIPPDRKSQVNARGFKVKLTQIRTLHETYALLLDRHVRLIYLERSNQLKAALSELNGRRLHRHGGIWNAEKPTDLQGPVRVDTKRLLKTLRRREIIRRAHDAFYDLYRGRKIRLVYEDLLQDETAFHLCILRFLGLPDQPLHGKFLKHTPDRLQAAITNYGEIRHALRGSAYEYWLGREAG